MSPTERPRETPVSLAAKAVKWPFALGYELLQLPTTMKHMREASEMMKPVIDDVSNFAKKADGSLGRFDRALGDIRSATTRVTAPAQSVRGALGSALSSLSARSHQSDSQDEAGGAEETAQA